MDQVKQFAAKHSFVILVALVVCVVLLVVSVAKGCNLLPAAKTEGVTSGGAQTNDNPLLPGGPAEGFRWRKRTEGYGLNLPRREGAQANANANYVVPHMNWAPVRDALRNEDAAALRADLGCAPAATYAGKSAGKAEGLHGSKTDDALKRAMNGQ